MGNYYPGFATGGTQWFVDLTACDTTYALPVLNACLFLTIIELGGENAEMNNPKQKMIKNVFRAMGVAMVPFTMYLPQGLFVYWVGNGLYSILQVSALKNDALKKLLDIPAAPPPGYAEGPESTTTTTTDASGNAVEEAEVVEDEKSPMMKLYEENLRLIEANKKLMDKHSKGGKGPLA